MKLAKKLYNLCFIIIAQNALNLNMNFLFTDLKQKEESANWHQDPIAAIKKTKPRKEKRKSQLQRMIDKDTVKVVMAENNAYWVHENKIYKAVIDNQGRIDASNAEEIDVFSLSEKETIKLMDILDSIRED